MTFFSLQVPARVLRPPPPPRVPRLRLRLQGGGQEDAGEGEPGTGATKTPKDMILIGDGKTASVGKTTSSVHAPTSQVQQLQLRLQGGGRADVEEGRPDGAVPKLSKI